MVDASGLRHQIGKGMEGPLAHVLINLICRFEGETDIRHHLQAVSNRTY